MVGPYRISACTDSDLPSGQNATCNDGFSRCCTPCGACVERAVAEVVRKRPRPWTRIVGVLGILAVGAALVANVRLMGVACRLNRELDDRRSLVEPRKVRAALLSTATRTAVRTPPKTVTPPAPSIEPIDLAGRVRSDEPRDLLAAAHVAAQSGLDVTIISTRLSEGAVNELLDGATPFPRLTPHKVRNRVRGVRIEKISSKTSIAMTGIRSLDVITAINGRKVDSPEAIEVAFQSATEQRRAVIEIVRGAHWVVIDLAWGNH